VIDRRAPSSGSPTGSPARRACPPTRISPSCRTAVAHSPAAGTRPRSPVASDTSSVNRRGEC
jgi:hypothetical protein